MQKINGITRSNVDIRLKIVQWTDLSLYIWERARVRCQHEVIFLTIFKSVRPWKGLRFLNEKHAELGFNYSRFAQIKKNIISLSSGHTENDSEDH